MRLAQASLGRQFARPPAARVYPGSLGRANQLAQILVQEVRHACSAFFLWCSVSVMHDGTEHFRD